MTGSGRLDVAIRRLERAASMLEQRLGHRVAEAGAQAGGLFDLDRARLASDLDASRAKEALAAVDKAIADVEAALGEPTSGKVGA
jgi:hypothetical protein